MESLAVGVTSLLGFVLVRAAVPKLLAPRDFETAVRNYELVPQRVVTPFARVLPWFELALAALLFAGLAPRLTAAAAALTFGGFAVAVAVNLLRG